MEKLQIKLRKLQKSDSEKVVRWRNNPSVLCNFIDQRILTLEDQNRYFEARVASGLVAQYIIECDGLDVGTCFLKDIDFVAKTAEFGIFIGEDDCRGKGIGTVAARLILELGFDVVGLDKIHLRVKKTNTAGQRAYEKVGFVVERKEHDLVFMAISKGEFKRCEC